MHDTIVFSLLHGNPDSPRPWSQEPMVKFLCPAPGYDRHFAITESFGIEMIAVPMRDDGPDIAMVAELVAADPQIKGMWVVPTYSNPTGAVYSEEVARALASMPTAAPDFRLFWDNAYAVHPLVDECAPASTSSAWPPSAGNPNRPLVFASTSKITFAGAGVSFFGGSARTWPGTSSTWARRASARTRSTSCGTCGSSGTPTVCARTWTSTARSWRPKFALVLQILEDRLGASKVASWTEPKGGYFISLDVVDGTAKRVIALAKDAGIAADRRRIARSRTKDPEDKNIRLAPSFRHGGARDGDGRCRDLRAARGHRVAAAA